jgi:4-hydroxybenzoate polyprenyltransferase
MPSAAHLEPPPSSVSAALVWVRAARVAQWSKNGLIFLPLLCAHRWADFAVLQRSGWAFLAFSLLASHLYLINDIADRHADRRHPEKRHRPVASGAITVGAALVLSGGCAVGGLCLAAQLSWQTLGWCVVYEVAVLAYSFWLKKVLLLDVFMLGAFYTLRVIVGGAATGIPVSQWLLLFGVFFFISLALIKRYAALRVQASLSPDEPAPGAPSDAVGRRAYFPEDAPLLMQLGLGSGTGAAVILALYVQSASILTAYAHGERLWALSPCVLFWIGRLWLLARRGVVGEDMIHFAFRDRETYLTLAVMIGVCLLARPI